MDERYRSRGIDLVSGEHGVLTCRITGQGTRGSLSPEQHTLLARLWNDLSLDRRIRSVLIEGTGGNFCSGGDLRHELDGLGDWENLLSTMESASLLVHSMVSFPRPIVACVEGAAVGAGLAIALLADIAVVAKDAILADGHTRIGLPAGDHAVLVWPLLCGLAHAKRILMLGDALTGEEAASLGMVAYSEDPSSVKSKAAEVASRLAAGPAFAVQSTKHSLNHWLRAALPAFDASLAREMLGASGPEFREGLEAFLAARHPEYFDGA